MTDRELLELAAKAAGMKNVKWVGGAGMAEMINPDNHDTTGSKGPNWNPLIDDGDALRLAAKLNLSIQSYPTWDRTQAWHPCTPETAPEEPHGQCRYAATRRAIVRAAAEIGKQPNT